MSERESERERDILHVQAAARAAELEEARRRLAEGEEERAALRAELELARLEARLIARYYYLLRLKRRIATRELDLARLQACLIAHYCALLRLVVRYSGVLCFFPPFGDLLRSVLARLESNLVAPYYALSRFVALCCAWSCPGWRRRAAVAAAAVVAVFGSGEKRSGGWCV